MVLLASGTILQDRYRVERLIGQGGFGAVYEAVDLRLNRRVALKQLLRAGDRISRQFEREAQLLANLDHQALPNVNDHFSTPDGQFLVMQYVPGEDLGSLLLQRNAPFPVEQVLGWAFGLLDALSFLHSRRPPIVHRDIKPQNLKLQHDGSIMLLDFGLAKGSVGEASPTTERSLMAYTLGFAPPEQVEGLGTDERSDLYALGATLYSLLTGMAPVEAQTRLLAAARGRPDPLQPAHVLNPAVPEAVSYVLALAMQLEREDRPQNAQAMRTMLAAARDGVATPQPPSTPAPPAFRSDPTLVEASGGNTRHVALEPDATVVEATPSPPPPAPAFQSEATVVEAATPLPAVPTPVAASVPAPTPAAASVPAPAPAGSVISTPAPAGIAAPSRPGRPLRALLLGGAVVLVVLALALAVLLIPRNTTTADAGATSSEATTEPQPTQEPQPTSEPEPTGEPEPTTEPEPEPTQEAPAESASAGDDPAQTVDQRVANAEQAFARAGGFDDAAAELEAAVELDDANPELHSLLAIVYMQRLRWDDVEREAARTIELDPNYAVAYSILSQAHREQGEYDQALADADKALELDPELSLGYAARSYVNAVLAEERQDPGMLDAVLDDAAKAVESAGDEDSYSQMEAQAAYANAYATRYRHTTDQADLDQAVDAYNQASSGGFQLARHFARLGVLLSDAGRVDEARTALEQAVERDPGLAFAHEALGWLLYRQGEYDAAIGSFTQAIELFGETEASASPYYGRAVSHHANASLEGKDQEAELTAAYDDLSDAVGLDNDEGWYWYELGMVSQTLFQESDPQQTSASTALRTAAGYFQAELDENAGNADAQEGLGWSQLGLEEWDAAIAAFDAAIAAEPDGVWAYLGKSRALRAKDDIAGACQAIGAGLAMQPNGSNPDLEAAREELSCQ